MGELKIEELKIGKLKVENGAAVINYSYVTVKKQLVDIEIVIS